MTTLFRPAAATPCDDPAPVPVDPGGGPTRALHGIAAHRAAEQAAQSMLPPHALMQRAGEAVARLALAVAPHARRIWIACGPGNNGGDGLQAAAALRAAGREVEVGLLGDPARLPADARAALADAQQAGVTLHDRPAPGPGTACGLAIDALLGLGTHRAPQGAVAEAVRALQACGAPVLAVDLPSGLDAQTGRTLGDAWVRADHTLSLVALKPGLFTAEGRDAAGRVWLATLGADAAAAPAAWLWGADDANRARPARRHAQHKGSFGDVVVIGGAPGMSGAAWLAARAALAAGAGKVHVAPLDPGAPDAGPPELMVRRHLLQEAPELLDDATVACGCGGGTAVRHALPEVLRRAPRLVLDADALNAIAADATLQRALARRGGQGRPTLLTPHPLEAARLLGIEARTVQADRFAAAQSLAVRFDCAVLLKGSGTVCAAPGCVPTVNPTGNALLATAGTGDVLAGWTAGLWAGLPGDGWAQVQAMGAAAAWWHGHAADQALAEGRRTFAASRLIEALSMT